MVAAQERVSPGRGAAQGVVLPDGLAVEHGELLPVWLEAFVGLGPDADRAGHLAFAVERATAGPIALVLGTGRFRTQVGDVRQGAVAAVAAAEERDLGHLLEHMGGAGEVRRLEALVDAPGGREAGRGGG